MLIWTTRQAWLREEKQREALRTLMAELVDKEKDGVDDESATD